MNLKLGVQHTCGVEQAHGPLNNGTYTVILTDLIARFGIRQGEYLPHY